MLTQDTSNIQTDENNTLEQSDITHDDDNDGKTPTCNSADDDNDDNNDNHGEIIDFVPFSCNKLIDDSVDEGNNTIFSDESQEANSEQGPSDSTTPDDPREPIKKTLNATELLNSLRNAYKNKIGNISKKNTKPGDTPVEIPKRSHRTIIIAALLPIVAVVICFFVVILALNNLMFIPGYLNSDNELLSVDLSGECSISVAVEANGIKDDDMPFLVRIYGVDDENIYGYTDTTYTTLAVYAGEIITSTMESGDYKVEIVGAPMRVDGTIYSIGDSNTCTLSVGGGDVKIVLSSEEGSEKWDVRGVIRNYNLYIAASIDGLDLDILRETTLAVCEALDDDFGVDGEEEYELTDEEIQSIIDELYAEAEAAGVANAKNNASSSSSTSDASNSTSGSGTSSSSSGDGTSGGNTESNTSGDTSGSNSGHSNVEDDSYSNTEGEGSGDDGTAGNTE